MSSIVTRSQARKQALGVKHVGVKSVEVKPSKSSNKLRKEVHHPTTTVQECNVIVQEQEQAPVQTFEPEYAKLDLFDFLKHKGESDILDKITVRIKKHLHLLKVAEQHDKEERSNGNPNHFTAINMWIKTATLIHASLYFVVTYSIKWENYVRAIIKQADDWKYCLTSSWYSKSPDAHACLVISNKLTRRARIVLNSE